MRSNDSNNILPNLDPSLKTDILLCLTELKRQLPPKAKMDLSISTESTCSSPRRNKPHFKIILSLRWMKKQFMATEVGPNIINSIRLAFHKLLDAWHNSTQLGITALQ